MHVGYISSLVFVGTSVDFNFLFCSIMMQPLYDSLRSNSLIPDVIKKTHVSKCLKVNDNASIIFSRFFSVFLLKD